MHATVSIMCYGFAVRQEEDSLAHYRVATYVRYVHLQDDTPWAKCILAVLPLS
jgi:hypothetical protein